MLKPMVSRLGVALIALLMLVTLAPTAQALTFTVTSDTLGPIGVGDEIDLELTIDASDLVGTGTTFGYGISLLISGDAVFETVFVAEGGIGARNAAQFQVDAGTFGIVGGAPVAGLQEPQNTIDPTIVIMATFISGLTAAAPPGLDFTNAFDGNFVASVTLRLVDAGTMSTVSIAPGVGSGDVFDLSDVDILPDATFIGATIQLPEPHAAALSLASLVSVMGIVGLRRRRLTSIVD